jgi:glycosyltransferase involved in cell wall biosynthesis
MRIAIVYDCLYPRTVGGAERWYRALAERLAERHEVTYVTRRQWGEREGPGTPFAAVAVSPGGELYTRSGRRRIWPPVRFGIGVFFHLVRRGHEYDAVHVCSFPYFSVIAAWLALRVRRGPRLVVDWFELWSRGYWIEYLGSIGGRIGHAVQGLCARLPDQSFVFSRLHEGRLVASGHRAPIVRLTGIHQERDGAPPASGGERLPVVVFAGRHIPEKDVALVPEVIAAARTRLADVRGAIFGDGPERERVIAAVRRLGLEAVVEVPGRVEEERVRDGIARAACLLLPSRREGYGLVVVEAAAAGTPSVVVSGPDNAAVELIEDGVNGRVAPSSDVDAVADAVVEVVTRREELARSTAEWYSRHGDELSIESSLAAVEAAYAGAGDGARGPWI